MYYWNEVGDFVAQIISYGKVKTALIRPYITSCGVADTSHNN